jgi:hypothetical protein
VHPAPQERAGDVLIVIKRVIRVVRVMLLLEHMRNESVVHNKVATPN